MRPRAIPLVIAATLLAELLVASPSSTAPLIGGVLAFASDRGGTFDIYQAAEAEEEGTSAGRLTSELNDQLDPAWSLEGSRFAYARVARRGTSSSIWVGGVGGTATALTSGSYDRQPTWSPDGLTLAFVRSSRARGTSRLYLIDSGGGRVHRRTNPDRGRDWAPAWSPDGQTLAFASTRSGSSPDIYVMNATGGGVRRLTSGSWLDGNPSWSPDSGHLVFERCCPGGSSELYTVDPATGETSRLTTTPEDEFDPAWSPDGLRIAFVRSPAGGGNRDLFTMAPDGTDARAVTADPRADLAPTWRLPSACDGPDACASAEDEESLAALEGEDEEVEPAATAQASGPGRVRQRSTRIVSGVTLVRRVHRRGPKRVFALVVNPRRRPKLDVALAGGRLQGFARTRSLARAHRALAAVNGDFALPSGSPVHAFAEDGVLMRTTLAQGRNFAVSRSQRRAYTGAPRVDVLLGENSGGRFRVTRWNDGAPVVGEMAAYTGAGEGVSRPPAGSCVARLRRTGGSRWYGDKRGLERTYAVKKAGCFSGRVRRGRGAILLAARPGTPEGAILASLTVDGRVTLRWSFGWTAVLDSIGGTPLLVEDGKVVAGSCSADICHRHPRTAIGYTKTGKVILMVVDGRRRRWSVGMSLVELAREMRRLGAVGAVNLDGGGSSTMVVRGKIKNRPSDGRERAVSSAVLVLRGRDRGDPSPGPAVDASGGGTDEDARTSFALDPASTGGLLDALQRGAFGGGRLELPPEFRELLNDYRLANR